MFIVTVSGMSRFFLKVRMGMGGREKFFKQITLQITYLYHPRQATTQRFVDLSRTDESFILFPCTFLNWQRVFSSPSSKSCIWLLLASSKSVHPLIGLKNSEKFCFRNATQPEARNELILWKWVSPEASSYYIFDVLIFQIDELFV